MPDMPDTGATADGGFARALIVMAHPDDPEFTAGGTIAAWTSAGTEVAYVIVTDGSKGTSDRTMSVERLVPLREREQRAAGRTLGVDDITFSESWGLAGNVGVDVAMGGNWFFNVDAKYITLSTEADLRLADGGSLDKIKVEIDPFVFGVGVGYRFR